MRIAACLASAFLMALMAGLWAWERHEVLSLARSGEKLSARIESTQVRRYLVMPDSFYLHYTYFPPGGGSVPGRISVSERTWKTVKVGTPIEIRMHRFRKHRHVVLPYSLDAANDWSRPLLHGLIAIGFLYWAWAEYRYGDSRRAAVVR